MILGNYTLASPRLVLKFNHGLPERSLSAEVHFLNGLLKQFCIDFVEVHDDLNAEVLYPLVILSKDDQ